MQTDSMFMFIFILQDAIMRDYMNIESVHTCEPICEKGPPPNNCDFKNHPKSCQNHFKITQNQ